MLFYQVRWYFWLSVTPKPGNLLVMSDCYSRQIGLNYFFKSECGMNNVRPRNIT